MGHCDLLGHYRAGTMAVIMERSRAQHPRNSDAKAYIKRNKHDAADAEAICEAVQRPTMRFVPVKTADQQAAVLLHRGRARLVRQRTGLVNALRGHLAEFGVIAPQGLRNVGKLIAIVRDEGAARLPDLARQVLQRESSRTAGCSTDPSPMTGPSAFFAHCGHARML